MPDVAPARLLRSAALKRSMDLLGAAVGLAVCALPMLLIAIAIRATMGGPVLFRQTRPGLRASPFRLWKFRTMTDAADAQGRPLPDEARLTRLGRFLRETSLDELPGLLNVLRGEMSLVGPRPLLTRYLSLYSPEQARRHEVKPGLTGWAQVNGRNAITWEQKFQLDTWYVDHWNVLLDVKILLMTAVVVLHGRGVSQPGRATVDYFSGGAERTERSSPAAEGAS